MALQLKIRVQEEQNSFIIYDCTGSYSSLHNPGGWGLQNFQLSDLTSAYLEITTPGQLAPVSISVYPDFPNNNKEVGYEILPYMVGLKEIESGGWITKLIVNGKTNAGVEFTRTAIISALFVKSVFCCIDKAQPKLNTDVWKDDKQKKILELSALMESVKWKEDCGLDNKAAKIIDFLKEQCKCAGC